jgi:hypothetical protein
MAADLRVSHPVVWKVTEGGQTPPGKLIEALARDPRVNLTWLFRGEGTPTDIESDQGIAIPIAKQILRGSPEKHRESLSGEFFSLAANFYRPGRFWLEIQPGDPALRSQLLRLNIRDLLLMDTDRSVFPTQERLGQQLCGVSIKGETTLGLVDYVPGNEESGPSRIEVDTFDLGVDPSEVFREVRPVMVRGRPRRITTFYRWVQSEKTGKKVKEEVTDLDLEPFLPTIKYEDILCVSVLMVRRSPTGR